MEELEIIKFYIDNGVLISPELMSTLKAKSLPLNSEFSVIGKEALSILESKIPVDVRSLENSIVLKQKHKDSKIYDKFMEFLDGSKSKQFIGPPNEPAEQQATVSKSAELDNKKKQDEAPEKDITEKNIDDNIEAARAQFMKEHNVRVIEEYAEKSHARTVPDFVNYFNSRFKDIEKILRGRQELQNLTSINRITAKRERDNVALIGAVYDKSMTKNDNVMLTLEDPTGMVKVVVNKTKEDIYALAQDIQLDEIIGVTGLYDNLVFANSILLPDIPLTKELKKSPDEGYFIVIADPQVGNKLFLEKEFKKFLSWLNMKAGSDAQKDIASKIKYIFIAGDLVDGVGIYPDQEYDLTIIDIKDQYKAVADLISQMPKEIPIIVCPGNHDVGRMSEPQPKLHDEYSKPLSLIKNIILVSNPCLVNIFEDPQQGFEGFDVLLYHGFSFVYYAYNVPSIRRLGGQKRPDLIMKYLLQRRHLAPSHTSTLYIPDPKKDYLVINKAPDFFFTGHIHRASVNNYRNVTCINASAWVSKSDEQERRGLEPQPGRVFIINMQTREVKIMNFLSLKDADGIKSEGVGDES